MDNHHSEHSHLIDTGSRSLKITLAIVLSVMSAEIVGGILSGSLALLGDAGHMLVDALALGISLFALKIARTPATSTKTYGYHRVEIMAALANGVTLVLVSVYIFYEAYHRFIAPPVIQTSLMLLIATIGLVANLAGLLLLRRAQHTSLNVRAAFWHIIGDTISSVGVIVAAVVISVTGWYLADPIIAIFIGCIILWGAVRIVREATDILMESVPKHVDVNRVVEALKNIPGIDDIHDIHIWTITSGIYAMSAHLVIGDQTVRKSGEILKAVNDYVGDNFNITHTTLQLECERYDNCPDGLVCTLRRPNPARNHGQDKPDGS